MEQFPNIREYYLFTKGSEIKWASTNKQLTDVFTKQEVRSKKILSYIAKGQKQEQSEGKKKEKKKSIKI